MKKLVYSLAILLAAGGIYQANAQVNLSGGVKANANMSSFLLGDMSHTDSKMKPGASLGGFLNIEFGSGAFAIQPEIMFNYYSSKIKEKAHGNVGSSKSNIEYWGMEIPIYAVGQLKMNNNSKWYLGIGPYVGCGFSLKDTTNDIKLYKNDRIHRFDFGGAAMVGYQFGFGLQINAGYKASIINLVNKGGGKIRSQAVSLGVGYAF